MTHSKFIELIEIIKRLRKECPWDKKQTFDSLKAQTLEETYEVIEAIDERDFSNLKSELGDLLLHIIFYATMAEEKNLFNINDVINSISEKLIRRHPHIFSTIKADTPEKVKQNWEAIKLKEGKESVLDGVPKFLPGLQRAARLQDKASNVGFDWENKSDVWNKFIEEIDELKEAEKNNDSQKIEKELGDVFFALINYSRFLNVNPENALRKTNEKFIKRFQFIEKKLAEQNKSITSSNLEEMDKFWNESKLFFP